MAQTKILRMQKGTIVSWSWRGWSKKWMNLRLKNITLWLKILALLTAKLFCAYEHQPLISSLAVYSEECLVVVSWSTHTHARIPANYPLKHYLFLLKVCRSFTDFSKQLWNNYIFVDPFCLQNCVYIFCE